MTHLEGEKSSNDVKNNDRMNEDEVAASKVRYLFSSILRVLARVIDKRCLAAIMN